MDIDALLMEQHLIPSMLMHEGRHLSYLDPSNSASSSTQAGSLPVNSRQQLPLWLARSLHQRSHIQMDMPACYGTSYREALRSDPSHMNLRDHSEYYFAIGKELSTLLEDEELIEQLGLAFNRRAQELINTALNAGARADLSSVMAKLTLPEKRLLETGRESVTNFDKWRSRKARMESSQLVSRKRLDTNTQRSSRQRRG